MRFTRVLAPNPGPFTGPGTNTWVVTDAGEAVVVDPGPVIATHLEAIVHAVGEAAPVAVVVTHTHPDHAPAANPLATRLGVPAIGFAAGPEFDPTETVADGDRIALGGTAMTVVHTPGHTSDHVCLVVDGVMFTGDHVMGGSTVIIEDAAAYLDSLHRVIRVGPDHLCPGHGPEMPDAVPAVEAVIAHRRRREEEILAAVADGAEGLADIVAAVYPDVPAGLRPAAEQQVRVQVRKLVDERRLTGFPLSE
jgi:glyoxylase-like metal-dependent hydrolase (beta-lactamase superfamily II)